MNKNLESIMRGAIRGGGKRRLKGWSPERRARQAALIRRWQPWQRSTGPKTEAGKARCSMNALKHGCRGRAYLQTASRVRYAIRLSACTNEIARLLIRMRGAHPDLKPTYGMLLSAATDRLRQFREMHGAEKSAKLGERTVESGNSPTQPIVYAGPRNAPIGLAAPPPQTLASPKEALSSEARRA
jgi:hypothetical protein